MQDIDKIKKEIIIPCIIEKRCENYEICQDIFTNIKKLESKVDKSLSSKSKKGEKNSSSSSFIPRGIKMYPKASNIRILVIADNPGPINTRLDNWLQKLNHPDFNVEYYLKETWKVFSSGEKDGTLFHQNLKSIFRIFDLKKSIKLEEIYLTQNVKCGGFKGTEVPCAIRSICQEKWLKREIEILDPELLEFVVVLGKNTLRSVMKLIIKNYPQLSKKVILIPHPSWPGFKNKLQDLQSYVEEQIYKIDNNPPN